MTATEFLLWLGVYNLGKYKIAGGNTFTTQLPPKTENWDLKNIYNNKITEPSFHK